MSGNCAATTEQLCGCCAGITQETPELITNRPALSAIAYRAGRYATFYASLLAALSDPDFPPLAALRTRSPQDFSIALLDAWSVVLDIVTFYQERYANEAFLRTATDQRSVFELARLVGYVPSPGVSASAVLAFTLSSAPGSPDNVLIPAGTRVQSVPGPGQTPQVFETSSDLTAVIAGNEIPAQTQSPWQLQGQDTNTWIAGTANHISPGDALLFISAPGGNPSVGGPADFRYVSKVSVDPNSGNTQLWWNQPLVNLSSATSDAVIYVFRSKGALFGAQAPNPFLLPDTTRGSIPGAPQKYQNDWNYTYAGGGVINLDAVYSGLEPAGVSPSGTPDQLQWLVLTGPKYTSYFQIAAASETNPNLYAVSAKTTQLQLSTVKVLAGNMSYGLDQVLTDFTYETRVTTAWVQSQLLTGAQLPLTNWTDPNSFTLAPGMVVPVQGTHVAIVGGQQITSGQPVGCSGQRVRLQVLSGEDALFVPAGSSGLVPVTDNQVFLVEAFPPPLDPVAQQPSWTVTTMAGIDGSLIAAIDNISLLPADKNDPYLSEACVVNSTSISGDITTLSLNAPLVRIYDATTFTVNANAVESTNGETVQEILGSGDASNGALEFTLKQGPLTYVTAPSGNGTQSTLKVWVNNLQWHEESNLLAAGPSDRVFVTHLSPQGNKVVQFGNGAQGARTPTGQSNIRAVYRRGIGSAGMVSAGQLSQPLDRPQGMKSVTNPGAASGAADPASADDARTSAPLPTLTIGRIVSLDDYQNYALNFAGIAKALATWTWFGTRRGVFLTVAGEGATTLSNSDPLVIDLIRSLQTYGNPYIPLTVASWQPLLFEIAASVRIDQSNYDPGQVLASVWQAIQNAFSFANRQLAQNVVASQIVEIVQQTPGVIAVQLQALSQSGEPAAATVPAMLCASGPVPPAGAQMLLLDPASQNNIGVWS